MISSLVGVGTLPTPTKETADHHNSQRPDYADPEGLVNAPTSINATGAA
jgi:hypothetical protein